AVHTHGAGVHPGIGVQLAGSRLALAALVLVVREHQIPAAAVNVEDLAQAADGHHRAFDIPAGPTRAPAPLTAQLARLGRLPEHEVQRILLGLTHLDARADLQVLDLLARQLAVAGEPADPVIDVTVARRIGVALVDQGLDHGEHAVDVLGGTRLHVRTQHGEARLVL